MTRLGVATWCVDPAAHELVEDDSRIQVHHIDLQGLGFVRRDAAFDQQARSVHQRESLRHII